MNWLFISIICLVLNAAFAGALASRSQLLNLQVTLKNFLRVTFFKLSPGSVGFGLPSKGQQEARKLLSSIISGFDVGTLFRSHFQPISRHA